MRCFPIRLGFNAKIALGIIIVFGAFILAYQVHMPLWFKWMEWKLVSSDPAESADAAGVIAANGAQAVPYVQKWLASGSDKLIIGACKVAAKMDRKFQFEVLSDIYDVIYEWPSPATGPAVDAAMKIYYSSYYDLLSRKCNDSPVPIINVYLHKRNSNEWWGSLPDFVFEDDMRPRAVRALIYYLNLESMRNIHRYIVWELGRFGDLAAVEPLISLMKSSRDPDIRRECADSLGMLGDNRAVIPLIEILKKGWKSELRSDAACALGLIGDKRAVGALGNALEFDMDWTVRQSAASALGNIGGKESIEFLNRALNGDRIHLVRARAAAVIGLLTNAAASEYAEKRIENIPPGELFALSWLHGGRYLENLDTKCCMFMARGAVVACYVKWGNLEFLEEFLSYDPWVYPKRDFYKYFADVSDLMPDGLPKYDFRTDQLTRSRQLEKIREWYEFIKDRMFWDPEIRKYYLCSVIRLQDFHEFGFN